MSCRGATFIDRRWDEHGFSHLAMTLREDGRLIGYCGFQYVEETSNVELLYGMEPPYWNQGYVTEAARACLRFAYEHTLLDRIIALSYPENTGSWRVMEKLELRKVTEVDMPELGLVLWVHARDAASAA